jgi:hypothetical protein
VEYSGQSACDRYTKEGCKPVQATPQPTQRRISGQAPHAASGRATHINQPLLGFHLDVTPHHSCPTLCAGYPSQPVLLIPNGHKSVGNEVPGVQPRNRADKPTVHACRVPESHACARLREIHKGGCQSKLRAVSHANPQARAGELPRLLRPCTQDKHVPCILDYPTSCCEPPPSW